ncbi:phosphoribosylformylglycinamidine synthase [Lactovum odontotermitis]
MTTSTRIFVEKKEDFSVKNQALLHELKNNLQLKTLTKIQLIQVYELFHIEEELLEIAQQQVFSEAVTDRLLAEAEISERMKSHTSFAVESLPGQFDQRSQAAEDALFLLGSNQAKVTNSRLYLLNLDIDSAELERVKNYLLNPVDSRFKDLTQPLKEEIFRNSDETLVVLDFFNTASAAEFADYKAENGLAMEVEDLLFIQDHFKSIGRNPTETELKVLDTYWSDHCRHTTFETELAEIDFSQSRFQAQLQTSYDRYQAMRQALGRSQKPTTLMELATIFGRYERANGRLDDMEVSEEINACSVEIEVDVDGVKEPWLLMFKNETHNHPTEIEPFGGASTCIGGAIRDPLSGRSYVYQAMRITGAGDILQPIAETRAGKLPQQVISKRAAHGYSSYGNQIGLATTYVKEYYHPGFVAKRLEVGAVVGAVPKANVKRLSPAPGDVVIMFGGRTGRDGIGGATGSSKVQTEKTVETAGSEVQKGNAIEERKIQRLFRKPEVTALIKKSNDFGAGGVCVAIGELADGLEINLDLVPLKYQGLNGTEIAISESQERMSVVVDKADASAFIAACRQENLEAVAVARVTSDKRLVMTYKGQKIVDIARDFLNTNGKRGVVGARVIDTATEKPFCTETSEQSLAQDLKHLLSEHNHASQKGLQSIFDSSIGRSTVNAPLGGSYQLTPTECSVQKLPVLKGRTNTVSLLAHGYSPEIAGWSAYHGAAYAIIEAAARLVASNSNWTKARFSYQEYFERMNKQAEKFGQPLAALLGAIEAQTALGLPSIGGKDSMSGTYEELTVPPTLIAFGVTTSTAERILSPEFKAAGENIYYVRGQKIAECIDFEQIKANFALMSKIFENHSVTAAISTKTGGLSESLALMTFGNHIGAAVNVQTMENLLSAEFGGFIFTSPEDISDENVEKIGCTTDEFVLKINDITMPAVELLASFEGTFEPVYPTVFEQSQEIVDVPAVHTEIVKQAREKVVQPLVYIPVFPGTNCEYDSARAFEAAGAKTVIVPFITLDAAAIDASIQEMAENISRAQIILFPGGFSQADEPDGSAKFIVSILKNPMISQAIGAFIARGGLIIGICNGFQALVKSGLLPYGHFDSVSENSPTLFYNDANQHVAKMVTTRISNTNSPWLSEVEVGQVHSIPVSHGEGKFVVNQTELQELIKNGQIISQYCDFDGKPSMDSFFNPNGSSCAIEGIVSKNGQILGKMGHSERFEDGLFKNIPGSKDQRLFESAVRYFQDKM